MKQLACVASVSVVFQREEESKKDGLDVLAMEKWGESKIWKRGRGGKEKVVEKRLDFKDPVWQ